MFDFKRFSLLLQVSPFDFDGLQGVDVSVTIGNNQIGLSTEEEMKNTPKTLFCSISFLL